MSIYTKNPSNPNFLHPNKFQLNFSRTPNVQYFCQSINVPGISIGDAVYTTPVLDMYFPGEKPTYDMLSVTFYVDEDLKTWKEIHDWIRALNVPRNENKLKKLNPNSIVRPEYSDATITVLTSSNNPNIVFKFRDVFPLSLSTFMLSTAESPTSIITADVTFRFLYYDIETVNTEPTA